MGAAAGLTWTHARLASWLIFDLCEARQWALDQWALPLILSSWPIFDLDMCRCLRRPSREKEQGRQRNPSNEENRGLAQPWPEHSRS